MLELDGSHLEGGGQMLRTALGLSAVTQQPFNMVHIRKGRTQPGVKEQHLQTVNALQQLCDAKVRVAHLGSSEITFEPGKVKKGDVHVKINTAGSVGLVLQALLIPALKTDLTITVEGGATFGTQAMPVPHLEHVLLPLLAQMGYACTVDVTRHGFYPKGGAVVKVHSPKAGTLKPLELMEKGKLESLHGLSLASASLKNARVAERQASEATMLLSKEFKMPVKMKAVYDETICPGSGIQLWAVTEHSVLGGNGLGERGKQSALVGSEAAERLIKAYHKGTVDSYTADQLLPYLALAGGGTIVTSEVTQHARTNAFIIEKFLDARFTFQGTRIICAPK